jgi:hypothetical protein
MVQRSRTSSYEDTIPRVNRMSGQCTVRFLPFAFASFSTWQRRMVTAHELTCTRQSLSLIEMCIAEVKAESCES